MSLVLKSKLSLGKAGLRRYRIHLPPGPPPSWPPDCGGLGLLLRTHYTGSKPHPLYWKMETKHVSPQTADRFHVVPEKTTSSICSAPLLDTNVSER